MGLMSDLKEFGQNFVLAAGTGIAKNIEERAKEDRAAILAATKDLKSRIAKNKVAQTKIDNKISNQLKTTLIAAPGLADHPDILKNYLQTDGAHTMLLDAIKNDKDKSGYWISDYAIEKGFDPKDIYKKPKRTISISDIQSPLAPTKSKKTEETVSVDSDSILRTLIGANMSAPDILKEAEDEITGSGRGTLSEGDLKYANLVASRRIAPGSAPVTIRGKQKPLSDAQIKAAVPVKQKFLTALAPKGVKDAKQWAFRNERFVTQAVQNMATLSPMDYAKYVKGLVDSKKIDNQQERVLRDLLPVYYISALRTYQQEKGEDLKKVFGDTETDYPLPNQTN